MPTGGRITDHISLGVIAKTLPIDVIEEILHRTARASRRRRRLPAPVVMVYVIALALYAEVSHGEVLRCLVEGLRWLAWPSRAVAVTGKSGISQARSRLGVAPGGDGAALLWRAKKNRTLACLERLADGSYPSKIYASPEHRRHDADGRLVRVIECRLEGIADAEPLSRVITAVTDPAQAPACALAALSPVIGDEPQYWG